MTAEKKEVEPRIFLWLLRILAIIIVGTIITCWIFYADPNGYEWWRLSISRLGGLWVWDGDIPQWENEPSTRIFTIGFLICSGICLINCILMFIGHSKGKHSKLNGYLMLIMTVGVGLIAVPRDIETYNFLHYVGVFLFIGGFTFFNFRSQLFRRGKKRLISKTGFLDWLVAWLIIVMGIIYLVSLIIVIIVNARGDVPLYLEMISALSQKIVLVICIVAIFILDPDDINQQEIQHPEEETQLSGLQIMLNGIYRKYK